MPGFERVQAATLAGRLMETPRQIVAVFGPRQTGKATLIRQALVRSGLPFRYVAVDEPDPFQHEWSGARRTPHGSLPGRRAGRALVGGVLGERAGAGRLRPRLNVAPPRDGFAHIRVCRRRPVAAERTIPPQTAPIPGESWWRRFRHEP